MIYIIVFNCWLNPFKLVKKGPLRRRHIISTGLPYTTIVSWVPKRDEMGGVSRSKNFLVKFCTIMKLLRMRQGLALYHEQIVRRILLTGLVNYFPAKHNFAISRKISDFLRGNLTVEFEQWHKIPIWRKLNLKTLKDLNYQNIVNKRIKI